jgi:predicted RNA polymerase sigma factor
VTRAVPAPADATSVERVFREAYGQAVATLIRIFGDITLAEDAVQDAFVVASDRWRRDGVPPNPAGWIVTAARNRAIDRLRRLAGAASSTSGSRWSLPRRTALAAMRGRRRDP